MKSARSLLQTGFRLVRKMQTEAAKRRQPQRQTRAQAEAERLVPLLRIEDVSRALSIGRSKAYELMQNGTLPTVRIGRAVRVPLPALRKWIEEQTRKTGRRRRRMVSR